MSEKTDRVRNIFNQRRKKVLKDIEETSGMTIGEVDSIKKTIGKGMQEGMATFTPNREGGGILKTLVENKKGKKVWVETKITDKDEAALLLGLQGKTDK